MMMNLKPLQIVKIIPQKRIAKKKNNNNGFGA